MASFTVSYIEDNPSYKGIEDVIGKASKPIPNKYMFGFKKSVWLKVDIANDANSTQERYLSITDIQIMQKVHFYTVVDGKVVQSDENFHKTHNFHVPNRVGNILLYKNTLAPHQKMEVYIYITAKSNIYFKIQVGSFEKILSQVSKTSTTLIVFISALVVLGLYYLFLFLFSPLKDYLYYVLVVFSIAIWSFYIYGGFVFYFDVVSMTIIANLFITIQPLFVILFLKAIYAQYQPFYRYHRILNTLLALLVVATIYYPFARLGYIPYLSIAIYGPLLYLLYLIVVMSIAMMMFAQKFPYSGLFLLAYSASFVGSLITVLFFMGVVPYAHFTFEGFMIGGVVEGILFSALLTYRVRIIHQEREEALHQVAQKESKITILNETINFIAHQWRQPLAQINASVMLIDTQLLKERIEQPKINEELERIEQLTQYMSVTIDDFKEFFTKCQEERKLALDEIVEEVVPLFHNIFEKYAITLKIDMPQKFTIKGYKGDISQTLLVFINNAIEVLQERQIPNPTITIKSTLQENTITLEVCDNAGGVSLDSAPKIFDPTYTTKEDGSGLGLYISKLLIETKMDGSVDFINQKDGACFQMQFLMR